MSLLQHLIQDVKSEPCIIFPVASQVILYHHLPRGHRAWLKSLKMFPCVSQTFSGMGVGMDFHEPNRNKGQALFMDSTSRSKGFSF